MPKLSAAEILALPMEGNDAGARTIREYFIALVKTLWAEGQGFSGKRPFGNSSWEYEVFRSLICAGAIAGVIDEDGDIQELNLPKAHKLISKALEAL